MFRLKQLRESKNLTQKDLAKKINLVRSNVSKYELGQLEPNLETLKKLADFFDVSIDYLLGRVDNPEIKLIPKNEWPQELIDAGLEELPIFKQYTVKDITMEDMEDLIEAVKKINKRHS